MPQDVLGPPAGRETSGADYNYLPKRSRRSDGRECRGDWGGGGGEGHLASFFPPILPAPPLSFFAFIKKLPRGLNFVFYPALGKLSQ